MIFFFDTETTGKADMRAEPDAPHQPRIVQLAAILTDDTGDEMASVNLIIQPEGFEIPIGASSIHGITTQIAIDYGVELVTALQVFAQLCRKPKVVVGHNIAFDLFMMRGEYLRAGFDEDEDPFEGASKFCTMLAMTDICQLSGPYGYKWPKLQEAHRRAFGCEFDGAHNALADVRACAKLYWWIQTQPKATP